MLNDRINIIVAEIDELREGRRRSSPAASSRFDISARSGWFSDAGDSALETTPPVANHPVAPLILFDSGMSISFSGSLCYSEVRIIESLAVDVLSTPVRRFPSVTNSLG